MWVNFITLWKLQSEVFRISGSSIDLHLYRSTDKLTSSQINPRWFYQARINEINPYILKCPHWIWRLSLRKLNNIQTIEETKNITLYCTRAGDPIPELAVAEMESNK